MSDTVLQFLASVSLIALAACSDTPETVPPEAPEPDAPRGIEMNPYEVTLPGAAEVRIAMVPIPSGEFTMGSAAAEAGHSADEAPAHRVAVAPFWMSAHEIPWEAYALWAENQDAPGLDPALREKVDGVARPTPAYTDMTFGMGRDGHPAICMTQRAASTFCEWLSAVTGHEYRLPTEAEWEYACRAGTTTAYSFGDDPAALGEHAWFGGNSEEAYHPIGQKKPNPWGLFDMHGNVAEWVLDQYSADTYAGRASGEVTRDPLLEATKTYPRVVRGGSWQDDPPALRSAARRGSEPSWKQQDPQIPKSVWYHTDALFVGFRVVRTVPPQGTVKVR